jgi:hypothetical protein
VDIALTVIVAGGAVLAVWLLVRQKRAKGEVVKVWSDDFPRWMNRLAHLICSLLMGSALGGLLLMEGWRHRTVERSFEGLTFYAKIGSVVYGVGFLVYCFGLWRSRRRSSRTGL